MLVERLAAQRATAGLDRAHPSLVFSLLPWVLADLGENSEAQEIFYTGASLLAARYEELGLHRLLPTDRVWVGVRSPRAGAFGGFHHPDQGYRHLQMGAVITRYGPLDNPASASPELVALDLLRAYAHDCLHYGSYREYRLWRGELVRTRYGINSRGVDGRTYSAPDPAGSISTRNLGVVMEGATDREAAAITRQAAQRVGAAEPEGVDRFAFRDVTGSLTADDLAALPLRQADANRPGTAEDFLSSMDSYARGVNSRYRIFLSEVGGDEADALHTVIVQATISGCVASLSAWLDDRHGPEAFIRLFRPPPTVGLNQTPAHRPRNAKKPRRLKTHSRGRRGFLLKPMRPAGRLSREATRGARVTRRAMTTAWPSSPGETGHPSAATRPTGCGPMTPPRPAW
ncbi:hypothetical protein ACQPYK_14095 [Streptosporangium sp. CA-135522]|uniref:hypothetical protein n=1 Tax=Streptosporangium sp. CA-135522 TaxID=3240072 RepID=UPI003D8B3186